MLGWELPPHNSGGLGVACYHLCKALANRDVSIDFVLPYKADHNIDFMTVTAATPHDVTYIMETMAAYDSYKFVTEDGRIEWRNIVDQQLLFELAVGQLVAEKEYDIIHAHDWLTFRAALRAKQSLGCPVIAHVHSIESDRAGGNRGNPFVHEIEELMFQVADRIVAVSEYTRQAIMNEYGVPGSKVEVVHNSMSHDDIVTFEDPNNNLYRYLATIRAQGYKVVTTVGRLTIQKGMTNFLRAAQLVIQRQPKTMFVVVGNGDQYLELIQLAADLGIAKNVIFTGFQRGKAWRDSLRIADVFVMPSVSEPFGLVALEGVAYGAPAIITKQSGVAEVLHSSLKVDFWDVNEMANQIINVVREQPLHDELLNNAVREVEKMTWQDAADRVFDLYTRQLAGAAS